MPSHILLRSFFAHRSGTYRDVFMTHLPDDEPVVFKAYYWGADFNFEDFEYMRMDAIITEKLSGSPRIVKSYGFCSTSIIGEALVRGDMEDVAAPTRKGRIAKGSIRDDDLLVRNGLNGTTKLEFALEMAEAVQLVHGYPGGLIIHDDIQLSQFLMTESGGLKLNDFNRGEIPLWNEKDQEYCGYRNNVGKGDVSFRH
jgi:hypothetical protein